MPAKDTLVVAYEGKKYSMNEEGRKTLCNFSYSRKINYYETDQMGIVHHSNYIRFMEEARIALLEHIGVPYDKIEEAGILIPVLSVSCEYRKACRFAQTFHVRVKPKFFNGIKMNLSYEIYLDDGKELYVTGETGHCFLDKKMRPVRLKKDYPEIYAAFAKWQADFENGEAL